MFVKEIRDYDKFSDEADIIISEDIATSIEQEKQVKIGQKKGISLIL